MSKKGLEYVESTEKRVLDTTTALFLGSLMAPVAVTVALEIMAENHTMHPILVQKRRGRNGELVDFHKFRTLWKAVSVTEPISGAKDPRASAIANVWRDTRLDELPQLWDILIGNYSFCGSRPPTPEHEETYARFISKDKMNHYMEATDKSPGLMTREQVRSVLYPVHTPEIIEWRIDGGIRYPQEATLRGDFRIIGYAARMLGSRMLLPGLMKPEPESLGAVR